MINALEVINFCSCDPGQGGDHTGGRITMLSGSILSFCPPSSLACLRGKHWILFKYFFDNHDDEDDENDHDHQHHDHHHDDHNDHHHDHHGDDDHDYSCGDIVGGSGSFTSAFHQPVFEPLPIT